MKKAFRRSALVAAATVGLIGSLVVVPAPAQAKGGARSASVALPHVTAPIPVTATSRPFIDRLGPRNALFA